ncbi:hypothetical protein ABVG11_07680 [Streptomyces sp. HD1123-B1]|uniref:hypothetical protein n=1 Tax=Streptomyces huangiella TaxID=3228804 RepID=UPI003D7CF5B4
MTDTAGGSVIRARRRRIAEAFAGSESGSRHPLVAVAMVLPLAVLLSIAFGGWEAVVTQASSVVGMLGR